MPVLFPPQGSSTEPQDEVLKALHAIAEAVHLNTRVTAAVAGISLDAKDKPSSDAKPWGYRKTDANA